MYCSNISLDLIQQFQLFELFLIHAASNPFKPHLSFFISTNMFVYYHPSPSFLLEHHHKCHQNLSYSSTQPPTTQPPTTNSQSTSKPLPPPTHPPTHSGGSSRGRSCPGPSTQWRPVVHHVPHLPRHAPQPKRGTVEVRSTRSPKNFRSVQGDLWCGFWLDQICQFCVVLTGSDAFFVVLMSIYLRFC